MVDLTTKPQVRTGAASPPSRGPCARPAPWTGQSPPAPHAETRALQGRGVAPAGGQGLQGTVIPEASTTRGADGVLVTRWGPAGTGGGLSLTGTALQRDHACSQRHAEAGVRAPGIGRPGSGEGPPLLPGSGRGWHPAVALDLRWHHPDPQLCHHGASPCVCPDSSPLRAPVTGLGPTLLQHDPFLSSRFHRLGHVHRYWGLGRRPSF